MLSTIDPAQASFDLGDLSTVPVAANDDRPDGGEQGLRCRPSAARNIGFLPKHLPRYDVVVEPESCTCSCCGGGLHCMGETTSEALDVVPAILRVRRTIRPRYACRACENGVVQAPAPARFMDGGMATTALAAHIVVSKFAWHLPLYRQTQIFAGYGVSLDRGTLGIWSPVLPGGSSPSTTGCWPSFAHSQGYFPTRRGCHGSIRGESERKSASSGHRPSMTGPGMDPPRRRSAISSPRAAALVRRSVSWRPSTAFSR